MLRNVASNVSIIQPDQFSLITSALVHIMMTKIPNASKCFYYSTKSINNNHLCPRPYQRAIPRGKHKWSQRPTLSLARPLHSTRCTQSVQIFFSFFNYCLLHDINCYKIMVQIKILDNLMLFFNQKLPHPLYH